VLSSALGQILDQKNEVPIVFPLVSEATRPSLSSFVEKVLDPEAS